METGLPKFRFRPISKELETRLEKEYDKNWVGVTEDGVAASDKNFYPVYQTLKKQNIEPNDVRLIYVQSNVLNLARVKLPDVFCIDCGSFEGYMVFDRVWLEAVPNYVDMKRYKRSVDVCLACLETRLNRNLVCSDFVQVQINNPIFLGYRMGLVDGKK